METKKHEAVWLSLTNLGFDADETDIEDFIEDLEDRGYELVRTNE